MKTREFFNTPLFQVMKANFAVVLLADASSADTTAWERRLDTIKRLGLNVIITAESWSRFPYRRTVVAIEQARLGEAEHLERITTLLASNWLELLNRQMTAESAVILSGSDAAILAKCLDTLYLNQATGDGVVELMLKEKVLAAMDESPAVEKVFASLEGEQGFKRIERILNRNLERAGRALDARLEERFADLCADLSERSRLVREAVDARAQLALAQHKLACRDS